MSDGCGWACDRRRFFVLSGKHLTYHEDAASVGGAPPIGTIHLDEAVVCTPEMGGSLKKSEAKRVAGAYAFSMVTSSR